LQTPKSNVDELIRRAIEQRLLLRLVYHNKQRIVEPHDYGVHNGSVKLLAYQVGGSGSGKLPNWRWLELDLISDIHLLEKTFSGGRAGSAQRHHKWDTLFMRVKPPDGASEN
jgi:predicted DNA-binding transcriptional regulator YafY